MNSATLAVYRARWRVLNAHFEAAWKRFSLREKRLLSLAALALLGLLLWTLLIEPPLKKIAYWQAETPKLRAQAAALEALLQGVSVAPAGQSLEQALRISLDASAIAGHYHLNAAQDNAWQLSFEAAPADAVLDWLLSQPRQFSLHVIEARLQRADAATTDNTAGTLSGSVRMGQAQGAKEAS